PRARADVAGSSLRSRPHARASTSRRPPRARTGPAGPRARPASCAPWWYRCAGPEAARARRARAGRSDRAGCRRPAACRLLQDARRGRAGDGPPSCEALAVAMPERDGGFAELPAQERRLSVHLARKVDESELDVLQLRTRPL